MSDILPKLEEALIMAGVVLRIGGQAMKLYDQLL